MTNSKHTKKAWLASMISMMLCVAMLIGSTFAWFTDTASTGVNKITAGNLDIALEYYDDSADEKGWKDAEDVSSIISEEAKWEPGYTEVLYFKVVNKGSLAADYKVTTNVVKEVEGTNQEGQTFKLSDYLQFGIVEVESENSFADRTAARNAVTNPNKFSNVANGEKTLEEGKSQIFAMVVWMPEETGNVANHNGINKPEIQFGVQVLASQATVESDSFDNQYDADAVMPAGPKLDEIVAAPKTAEELAAILTTALKGGSATGTITVNLESDFDLENSWTTIDGSNYSGVNKVVINGNGHYIENLNQPLLHKIFAGSEGSLTFNNLTIKNSTISVAGAEDVGVGVLLSTADATNLVTVSGCNLENVVITNTGAESYLGGFIGYSSSANVKFSNCSVKNCTFDGKKDIGAFIGYTTATMTVENCTVTGTTITSSNASTYRVGLVAGTVNVNPTTITGFTESGNTITQINASTVKTHDYVGRILADVYVDGTNVKK